MSDFAQRVRERLRDEKAMKKLSERDIADLVQWTQSKVAQKFSGRTPITLEELDALCFAVGILPSEAVRDRGLEFCAEMAPSELRVLEKMRRLSPAMRNAIMQILDIPPATTPERFATNPEKKPKPRLRNT